jgi:hypothetical protein
LELPKNHPLQDFRKFLYLVWKHLRLPKPTKRQLRIAHFLQHGPKRKVVAAFRGVGKSWITAAYVCWRLRTNPQVNILVISATKERADNFTTFCLRLINEMDILRDLVPESHQRCSRLSFDVAPAETDQNPSVRSAGITGQITGSRADEVVADDIEIPQNSATPMMREKLLELVKEFESILKPEGEAKITFLGTPQTEESIYNVLVDRTYTIRIWPARYPSQKHRDHYGDRLAPDIVEDLDKNPELENRTTEPERFTDEDLLARELSIGRSTFELQFMLNTSMADEDRYPLKLRDLVVDHLNAEQGAERYIWSAAPDQIVKDLPRVGFRSDFYHRPVRLPDTKFFKYTGIIMAVDPSGRGKDETAYAVVANLHSNLFLLDAGSFDQGYTPATLQGLAEIAKKYSVNKIIVEPNFGDGMFNQLLKQAVAKVYPVMVADAERASGQKERRIIDTLEPVLNSHRLIVDSDLIERDYNTCQMKSNTEVEKRMMYSLFWQLTHITKDRGCLMTDDKLDALAIAVGHFTTIMAVDQDRAAQMARNREQEAALQDFLKRCNRGRTSPNVNNSFPGRFGWTPAKTQPASITANPRRFPRPGIPSHGPELQTQQNRS